MAQFRSQEGKRQLGGRRTAAAVSQVVMQKSERLRVGGSREDQTVKKLRHTGKTAPEIQKE